MKKKLLMILISLVILGALVVSVSAYSDYEYADDGEYGVLYAHEYAYEASTASMVMFWILFGFIGFLVPGILLIIGLSKAVSKEIRDHKRWIPLISFSAVWVGCAAGITAMLLLA